MKRRFESEPEPINGPALHILFALGGGAKHGYAIMRDIDVESDGRIRLLPGTLYSTIKKLLNDGLIEEVDAPRDAESDDARRRYYRMTSRGRAASLAEMQRMTFLVRLGRAFLS